MAEPAESRRICPYLGLAEDRDSRFSYPEMAHICYAANRQEIIPLEHQSAYCLTPQHPDCPHFVELPADHRPARVASPATATTPPSPWRTVWLALGGLLAGLAIVFAVYFAGHFAASEPAAPVVSGPAVSPASPTSPPAPSPTATATPVAPSNTPPPTAVPQLAAPAPTATPPPGSRLYELSPPAGDIGWLVSSEDRGNHFGDSYLYAGLNEGNIYYSAFQFDLSLIPRGAPIYSAAIQLTGLRDDLLGTGAQSPGGAGVWTLRLLTPEIDLDWRRHTYQDIFNTPILQTLSPVLGRQDLQSGKSNTFQLSPAQIAILETRIVDDEAPAVSFRLEGPLAGEDSMFAWDTGYGPQSRGNKVVLLLEVGEPPATPPPFAYVVVTSTPTPENVLTAAAMVAQITAEAARVGTATPVPPNLVTATPFPERLVIVPTASPENDATAQAQAALATANALTTGTATPIPTNAVTATPTTTPTPTPTPTTRPPFVLITATPTPVSVFVAATLSAAGTSQARRIGTPTPLPPNWVTPIVVTATPTPLNAATAQAQAQLATAIAFTTGTPTPTPSNMVTATPTPAFEPIADILLPITPPPVPTARPMPPPLIGKILFRSDREEGDNIYIFDPVSGQLGRLTDNWPYAQAKERNTYSADGVYRAYTKQLLWTTEEALAIHFYDYKYRQENLVTRMGVGIVYDPGWSPVGNRIVFVATESGNDEIWSINHDGTDARQLTRNAWEWDKSPSWSPDGSQIVFYSNRSGLNQLWIMNADGSNQRLLLGQGGGSPYNDWEPVWVKYPDPVPLPN